MPNEARKVITQLMIKSETIILGAGVVGLSTALYLQRSGHQVTVIDPLPPGGGASFGNAGLINPSAATPIALPGMLRQVPRWLIDPHGPLAVRPTYFPNSIPWLLRWISASRRSRVFDISDAMYALYYNTFACWHELLGEEKYNDLFRISGHVRIWEKKPNLSLEKKLYKRQKLGIETLGANDLREMFPGIAHSIKYGILFPANGYTVNPKRLTETLADLFLDSGGKLIAERALKIIPQSVDDYMVMTNLENRYAERIVVATGAWSRDLLSPLGIHIPLESERGYHAMIAEPNINLRLPITNQNRGFGLTPMEGGLRVAGTVEIGGLRKPPSEFRARLLIDHARRLFPDLKSEKIKLWMGHRPSTPDSLPILGEVPQKPNIYLALGHGHFGMTGGPPSGRLLSRLINGNSSEVDITRYSICRFKRHSEKIKR